MRWKLHYPNLTIFWLIHPCDGQVIAYSAVSVYALARCKCCDVGRWLLDLHCTFVICTRVYELDAWFQRQQPKVRDSRAACSALSGTISIHWHECSRIRVDPTLCSTHQVSDACCLICPFDVHCYHMGTAIQHPVLDQVKPSFVIMTSGHSDAERQSAQMSKITNDSLTLAHDAL